MIKLWTKNNFSTKYFEGGASEILKKLVKKDPPDQAFFINNFVILPEEATLKHLKRSTYEAKAISEISENLILPVNYFSLRKTP